MKKHCRFIRVIAGLLPVLLLVSCAVLPSISVVTATSDVPAVQEPSTTPEPSVTPESALQEASPSPVTSHHARATPSAKPTPEPGSSELGENWREYGYDCLPMSIPEISEAEWATFNPELLMDYLAQEACHENVIDKAEIIDGVLYLTVSDHPYFWHVDGAYLFLKDAFSLSDEEILALPLFFGCVIVDETMYLSEEDYTYFTEHYADDFWDDFGYISLDSVTFDPIPVSDDARVTLFDRDISWDYDDVTMEEFTDYIMNGRTVSDFEADRIFLYDVVFQYNDGMITAILELYEQYF